MRECLEIAQQAEMMPSFMRRRPQILIELLQATGYKASAAFTADLLRLWHDGMIADIDSIYPTRITVADPVRVGHSGTLKGADAGPGSGRFRPSHQTTVSSTFRPAGRSGDTVFQSPGSANFLFLREVVKKFPARME
jgi:hypothetical protein